MKNKGFTLVELLAVIAILMLLITVITPKVIKQLNTSEDVTQKEQINTLINIAKIYTEEKTEKLPEKNSVSVVTVQELKESGLINKKQILDPKTNEELTGCIKIKDENNKYNYEYTEGSGWCDRPEIVTSGDGLYESQTEQGRLIYRGANPNNWIELNEGTNETSNYVKYRIISFELDGTIKVVRNDSLDNRLYDDPSEYETANRNNTTDASYCTSSSNGCNIWGSESNTYYNGSTLSETNTDFYRYRINDESTDYIFMSGHGKVTEDSTLNKYLNNTWISTKEMKNNITNHNFYVGGIYYSGANIQFEKSLQSEKKEEQAYIWNGKIGLINVTEYVEASINPTCTNVFSTYHYNPNYYYDGTQHLTEINEWPCSNTNYTWISNRTAFYTINRALDGTTTVWRVAGTGFLNTNGVTSNFIKPRPAFYLKSDITLTGEGTELNPYRVS